MIMRDLIALLVVLIVLILRFHFHQIGDAPRGDSPLAVVHVLQRVQ